MVLIRVNNLRRVQKKGEVAGDISTCIINNFLRGVSTYLRGTQSLALSEEHQIILFAHVLKVYFQQGLNLFRLFGYFSIELYVDLMTGGRSESLKASCTPHTQRMHKFNRLG